jgi:hypothetical protein
MPDQGDENKAKTAAVPTDTPPHVKHEGGGSTVPVDLEQQKVLKDKEKSAQPKPTDKPETTIPGKPISDMNPPGQEEPD